MADADFVVVGGGIYGAAVAYELTGQGSSVLLLEAGQLATRASGGPGKRGVRANGRNSRELTLARESFAVWPGLSECLGSDTGFSRIGGLFLISATPGVGDLGRARAEAHLKVQRSHGIATEMLERDELDALEPGLGEAEIAALYCPDEGIADQRATALAYAAAAEKRGACIRENSPVAEFGKEPRPFVRLRDGSRVDAGRAVILAANYGTNALLERSGHPQLPLWTMVPQVLMLQAKDKFQPRHLVGHLQKTLAMKPLADGITMISGGMRGKWDDESASGEPVETSIQQSLDLATTVFPPLREGLLVSADAGVPETYTPDGLPYLDFLDEDQQIFVAAGWHGHGFAIAPAVAYHLAQWLTTGSQPALLAPFKIRRS